jgi:hypothetical protein
MAFRAKNLVCAVPRVGAGDDDTGDGSLSAAMFCYVSLTADDDLTAMQVDEFITDVADNGIQVNDIIDFVESGVGGVRMIVSGLTGGNADTIAFI